MKINRFSGLAGISFCLSRELFVEHQGLYRNEPLPVEVYGDFKDIPISGVGEIVVTSEIVNRETLFTSKVKFIMPNSSECRLIKNIISNSNSAFILENTNKERFILGTEKKPYPIVKIISNNEGKQGGDISHSVEITYTNRFKPLLIQ